VKVAVLGAGPVGAALTGAWQRAGHDVVVGLRDPATSRTDLLPPGAAVASVAAAITGADAVVIAIPAAAVPELLAAHGGALDGGLLVDATNQLTGPPHDPDNARGPMHQLELFAAHVPRARVFRGFCSTGWEILADPLVDGVRAHLPYAGPDVAADRTLVEGLVTDVGLTPVWLGEGVAAADVLDGVARLWFLLALTGGRGRRLALHVLNEPDD
jgi:hypothetical protein